MTIRELAIYYAGSAHKEQMYGESPYALHLSAVDRVLWDANFDELHPVRIAAWLHDVIEDCSVTREALEKIFGSYVALLVHCVSNEPAANRKERALKTYPKIASLEDAVALKVADRIANLEHSAHSFSRYGLMYAKEDQTFRNYLYDPTPNDARLHTLWVRYMEAVKDIRDTFGIK